MTQRPSINIPIILASSSPRRRRLLEQLGLSFKVDPSDISEHIYPGELPNDYASRVAHEKAMMAAERLQRGIIIAADTIVVLNDVILGKPADRDDAMRMLNLLSGTVHRVITGLSIIDAETRRAVHRTVSTDVWFRHLSTEEIISYIDSGEPLDKAGAYGIQGKGALLVERIEGCYYNVVGLPLSVLGECLKIFGIILL